MSTSDVLVWLLEAGNPAARYLALTRLLRRSQADPEVLAARAAIPAWAPARSMLDAQWPEGYWVAPGIGHSPRHKATVWQIIFWAAIGGPRIPAIGRAYAYVLSHSRLADGRFSAYKTARGATLCLNGNLLRAMRRLGYEDLRLKETYHALARMVARDGYVCRYHNPGAERCALVTRAADGSPCVWGAVKALGAWTEAPEAWLTGEARAAIDSGIDLVAGELAQIGNPGRTTPGISWRRLGFPPIEAPDLIEALEVLAAHGANKEPGAVAAAEMVRASRTSDGRWLLDVAPGNMWSAFGQIGKPCKFVTLRALCALDHWEDLA